MEPFGVFLCYLFILRRKVNKCLSLLTYTVYTHTHTWLTAEAVAVTSCLGSFVEKIVEED